MLNPKLTKQHYSTKLTSDIIDFLELRFPDLNIDPVLEKIGLPRSYLVSENGWVSVGVMKKLSELGTQATGLSSFPFEVGQFAITKARMGKTISFLAKNAVSTDFAYRHLPFMNSLFVKVTEIKILKRSRNFVHYRLQLKEENLTEEEKKDLRNFFPAIIENSVGYYGAIPTSHGLPPASIECEIPANESPCLSCDFKIKYNSKGVLTPLVVFAIGPLIGLAVAALVGQAHEMSKIATIATFFATTFLTWLIIMTTKAREIQETYIGTVESLHQIDRRYSELQAAKESIEKLSESYKKFVPFAVFKELNLNQLSDIKLGDHKRGYWTAMFIDIRGFTNIAEKLSANEVFEALNQYLRSVAPFIEQSGGWIADIMGDGIFAIFPDSPDRALIAGQQILNCVSSLKLLGNMKIKCGIGISSGEMILGTIGYSQRMQATVVADAVNLAARLEKQTKDLGYPIICDYEAYARLSSDLKELARDLGDHSIEGKSKPVRLFAFKKQEQSEVTYPNAQIIPFHQK